MFENHELPNARDLFSKYIQYANLKQQKDALSLVCPIDFSNLKYTANNPIAQDFFNTLVKSLNEHNEYGSIYDLLKEIENSEELFSENITDKEEIIKIACYLREFIKIELNKRVEILFEYTMFESDEEMVLEKHKTWRCIHALNLEHLKMRQTINALCLYDIKKGLPKIVEFCKQGKWEEFVQNMERDDRESLELLILKAVFEDSLEWHKVNSSNRKIIGNRILTALTFDDSFKSYGAQEFFEILSFFM